MKKILLSTVAIVVLVGVYIIWEPNTTTTVTSDPQAIPDVITTPASTDYRNATYMIDGQTVTLVDGLAESEAAPGSASIVTTRYFGNERTLDLNGDGVDDVAFILTQESGGSGVFFYAVGAIATDNGYAGTDGFLLGDRIAPQSTDISQNLRHKNVVVFNYFDREPTESFSDSPSVGKSVYLKVVPETLQWGIVEPDFEGEAS
jgi:hypothetical protein